MTASELKFNHELNYPESPFFSRETMKFFKDKMSNFGVYKNTYNGEPCYFMYRKRELCKEHSYIRNKQYLFCAKTFKYIKTISLEEQ